MFVEWPTEEDWAKQAATFPLTRFQFDAKHFYAPSVTEEGIEEFFAGMELDAWARQLWGRLLEVHRSYVMVMFYYTKGIPDNPYFASPGSEGQSLQYFPNFQEKDWYTKAQFDYYADVFYHKIFSAWESIGHILNLAYDLGLERTSFYSACAKMRTVSVPIYLQLKEKVVETAEFRLAKKLRNDITHNYLPNRIGTGISRSQTPTMKTISVGVGKYILVEVFAANISACMELFVSTLEIFSNSVAGNTLPSSAIESEDNSTVDEQLLAG